VKKLNKPKNKRLNLKSRLIVLLWAEKSIRKSTQTFRANGFIIAAPDASRLWQMILINILKRPRLKVVVFENIQTNCPVTGEKINAEVSTYYKGRTVKFCCEDCISKFNEDPQKYLSMLDKPVDNKMKDEMSHDKMEHKGNNR